MTHWSIRKTKAREAQVAAIERATGLRGVASVINHALATTLAQQQGKETPMFSKPSPLEQKARDAGRWLVADSFGNPKRNEEHWFDDRREARAHVRERNWHQSVYGPNGEYEQWDGYKWQ